MESEKIVRGYDPQIIRRLFAYIKPYRWWFILALLSLVITSVAELLTPILIKTAMDEHILVSFVRVREEALNEESLQPVVDREIQEGWLLGGYLYLPSAALTEVSIKVQREQEAAGNLDRREWYWFHQESDALKALVQEKTALFIVDGEYAAILKEQLSNLSEDELRLVREVNFRGLGLYSIYFGVLLVLVLVFSFVQILIMSYIAQGVMRDMRMSLLRHTMKLSSGFLDKHPIGTMVSRLTNDVETVNEMLTSVATSLFRDFFMMIGVIVVLFSLNFRLALITTLSFPPIILLTWGFRSLAREAYRRMRMWVSEVNGFLSERITGMEIVQIFGQQLRSIKEFKERNGALLKARLREMYVFALFQPFIDLFTSVSIGVIIYFGARYFTDSAITLGVLIAFINLVGKFYQPVRDFSEKFNILQSAMAGSERVFDLLDSGNFEADPVTVEGKVTAAPSSDSPSSVVEFRNVHFHYIPGEPVLQDLSLSIQPGETVAVVGYTGAGKTTIAKLLARFWEIQEGDILLGNRSIYDIPLHQLRARVQAVQQEVFLFSGTLRDNITLGEECSPGKLRKAIEVVRADQFIDKLPDGLDTEVKEGGNNFSSGQKQLISFARIIVHDPEVVILDEATANIDTETEKLIQQAMQPLFSNRTSLVIAHRLSTINHANRILVLNKGVLVEEGSHAELMEMGGVYYNLYRLQYDEETRSR